MSWGPLPNRPLPKTQNATAGAYSFVLIVGRLIILNRISSRLLPGMICTSFSAIAKFASSSMNSSVILAYKMLSLIVWEMNLRILLASELDSRRWLGSKCCRLGSRTRIIHDMSGLLVKLQNEVLVTPIYCLRPVYWFESIYLLLKA